MLVIIMTTRIDYFEKLCEQYNSTLLQNEEEQLLLLPFTKDAFSFSVILPMQTDDRLYDLEIEENGKTVFEDSADLPSLGDENIEELEQMFRSEVSSTIKELLEMPFEIVDGEIIFQ